MVTCHNQRCIILSDGTRYSISDIANKFNGDNCVQLLGMTKLMIFDCCAGVKYAVMIGNTRNSRNNRNHNDANVLKRSFNNNMINMYSMMMNITHMQDLHLYLVIMLDIRLTKD